MQTAILKEDSTLSSLSLKAIFSGVVSTIWVGILLNLLGLGLGFTVFRGELGVSMLKTQVLWLAVVGVLSTLTGGWVAAKLSDTSSTISGALHGTLVCILSTLVTSFLLASTAIGPIVNGTMSMVTHNLERSGQTAQQLISQALPEGTFSTVDEMVQHVQQEVEAKLAPRWKSSVSSAQLKSQFKVALSKLVFSLQSSGASSQEVAQKELMSLIKNNTSLNDEEVHQVVSFVAQSYETLEHKLTQATHAAKEKVAGSIGKASLSAFFIFLFTTIAGAVGGVLATYAETTIAIVGTTTTNTVKRSNQR